MGFMDDMRKAQEMAAQSGQMGMPTQADMEYAQLAQKLATSGLPGVGTVQSVNATGRVDVGGGKELELTVDVALEGRDPYQALVRQYFMDIAIPHYQPGARFGVRVDPDDLSKVMLYGPAE